jgi:hypothetical protein
MLPSMHAHADRHVLAGAQPHRRTTRLLACTMMGLAAAGLVATFALGAPLLSVLLAGLLLLCPLLMWVPYRFRQAGTEGWERGRRP